MFLWQRKPTQRSNDSLWYYMSYDVENISVFIVTNIEATQLDIKHVYDMHINKNKKKHCIMNVKFKLNKEQ